ncbi:MAG: serine/threonine protein kinase [Planctomycetes bacterium]|nr:serine/threonine protein kinase [Planctomycetota bacterium]
MNPDRLARVFDVFKRSLDLDADRRAAFVASECADDVEVRDEVTKMLAHHAATGSFLEPPDAATMAAAAARVGEPEERRRYGEFELIEAMPRGGMGVVHRAYQPSLDRVVALKILGARFAPTQVEIDRFRREARAVAKLDHPGIVKLFQVGETDGDHWFAMEFVDGRNLQQELAIAKGSSPGDARWSRLLPDLRSTGAFATVATLVAAAADAIQHAHEHGIVHRDIKPSNLLLDRTGRLRVADFGLAKDESLGSLTNTGDVAGTAAYMSPEQAHVTKAEVDHRTDIYSLGVVLYELLTLTRPYEGKTSRDIIDRIGAADPPPVRKVNPRVPRDLALVCEKAMSREPADRYPTAKEFAEDLRRFLGHEAVEARGVGWWTALRRKAHRHRLPLALVLCVPIAGVGFRLETSVLNYRKARHGDLRYAVDDVPAPGAPLRHRIVSSCIGHLVELRCTA